MSWMFFLVDLVGNVMEELIEISYFRSVSGGKAKSAKSLAWVCVFLAIFKLVPRMLGNVQMLNMVMSVISMTAISLFFEMTWQKRMVFIPLFYVISMLTETMIGMMLANVSGIPAQEGKDNILLYTAGLLITNMAMFSLLKAVQFLVPSIGGRIPGYLLVPLLVLPVATFAITSVVFRYSYVDGDLVKTMVSCFAIVLLAVSNAALFYLLEYQQREAEEKNRARLIHQQMTGQVAYYRELAERQKISNKTMHDLKNQMFALRESMKNAPEKALRLMDDISGRVFAASPMVITGNEAVDSLINYKRQQMEEKQIRYTQAVYVPSSVSYDPLDLCVLLGNLLDNAIEANMKLPPEERFVTLNMTQQETCLSLTVSNAAAGSSPAGGDSLPTTKKDKELHGFGMTSVREIASKYRGNFAFQSGNNEFTAYVILQED